MNKIRGQNKKDPKYLTCQKEKKREKRKKTRKRKKESNNNLPRFSSCLRIFQGLQDQDPYSFFQPCAI
jgi:hypothetical protein